MQGFTFYRSYWETAQAIPDPAQRMAFLEACITYTLEDTEPEELPAFANIAFTAIRKQLDKSKARGTSAKKEEPETKQDDTAISDAQTDMQKKTNRNKKKHEDDLISENDNQTKSNEIKRNQMKSNEIKSDTDTDTVTDTVTENNNNVRQAAPVSGAQINAEFEKLWGMYPKDRRRGKKKAAAAYERARTRQKNPVTYTDVLLGINRYNAHIAARHIESRYVLQGVTYFCNERWSDEYGSGTSGSGTAAQVSKWEQGAIRNDYSDEEFAEFEEIAGAG